MKKVFVSLALVLLLGIIAISIYIVMQGGKGLTVLQSNPTPTVAQQTALKIMPETLVAQPNQRATMQVLVQNSQSNPDTVQLELAYDPLALTDVIITPGNYFSQPKILFSRVNSATGRISYVLQKSVNMPINTTAPVAILSFLPSSYGTTPTKISFLSKSAVKDANNMNILNGMYEATITFSAGTFTTIPTSTPTPMTNMPILQNTPMVISPTAMPTY